MVQQKKLRRSSQEAGEISEAQKSNVDGNWQEKEMSRTKRYADKKHDEAGIKEECWNVTTFRVIPTSSIQIIIQKTFINNDNKYIQFSFTL